MAIVSTSSLAGQQRRKINVLLVDDSAIVRRLMERWIGSEADMDIVGIAVNGSQGVEMAGKLTPDVVVLDIEMPVMDGLTALPKIISANREGRVMMASTLTTRNGEITLKAMSMGAAEYVAKPEANSLAGAFDYRREVIDKIRALGEAVVARRAKNTPWAQAKRASVKSFAKPVAFGGVGVKPEALFIGSSTGGPEALRSVFEQLAGKVHVPIFVVQHMPPAFTGVLAKSLDKKWSGGAAEARDGEPAKPGKIHIAPGGKHMIIRRQAGALVTSLNTKPPVRYCRPAVDPLFESAAMVCGNRSLCVVLTGMGSDGTDGARDVVGVDGTVIAQDEATSIVWGMPRAVTEAGLAAKVAPLDEIGLSVSNVLAGRKP